MGDIKCWYLGSPRSLGNKPLCMASHLWFAKGPQGIVVQSDGDPLLHDSCKQKQVAKSSGESVFQNPVTSIRGEYRRMDWNLRDSS